MKDVTNRAQHQRDKIEYKRKLDSKGRQCKGRHVCPLGQKEFRSLRSLHFFQATFVAWKEYTKLYPYTLI